MADMEFRIDGVLISDLKVTELKKECNKRGLSKTGSKKQLYKRLFEHMENEEGDDDDTEEESEEEESTQVKNGDSAKSIFPEPTQEETSHSDADDSRSPTKSEILRRRDPSFGLDDDIPITTVSSPVKIGKPPPPPPITADTKLNRVPFPHDSSAVEEEAPMETDENGSGDRNEEKKDAEKLPQDGKKSTPRSRSPSSSRSRSRSKSSRSSSSSKSRSRSPESKKSKTMSHKKEQEPSRSRSPSSDRENNTLSNTEKSALKSRSKSHSPSPIPEKRRRSDSGPEEATIVEKETVETKQAEPAKESRSRSASRSNSPKGRSSSESSRSRSRSGSRRRTSFRSGSSGSDDDSPVKTKMLGSVTAITAVKEEMAADESFHTASEDTPHKNKAAEPEVSPKKEKDEETKVVLKVEKTESSADDDKSAKKTDAPLEKRAEKPPRKRRWGTTSRPARKPAINISTDSLKGLIPEIKASAIKNEPLPDLSADVSSKDDSEPEDGEVDIKKEAEEPEVAMETEEAEDVKDTRVIHRTVLQDVERKVEAAEEDAEEEDKREEETSEPVGDTRKVQVEETETREVKKKKEEAKPERRASQPETHGIPKIAVIVDEPQKPSRAQSPPRNPVSRIVHVRHLVRPYTLPQLKEVLGRSGTLIENGFWIDKIKSHCFAKFENEEQAAACRLALHGTQWPSSNPKFLHVDFASQDEMEHFTQTGAPPPPASLKREVHQDVKQKEREKERERRHQEREEREAARKEAEKGVREVRVKKDDPERLRKEHVREWDRDKIRQRSKTPSPHRERRRSEGDRRRQRSKSRDRVISEMNKENKKDKKEKKSEEVEQPAKLLDDLFCKTKTVPCIYWLPLTEEQIVARDQRKKQRRMVPDRMEHWAPNGPRDRERERDHRPIFRDTRDRMPERRDRMDRGGNRDRERDRSRDRGNRRSASPGRRRR